MNKPQAFIVCFALSTLCIFPEEVNAQVSTFDNAIMTQHILLDNDTDSVDSGLTAVYVNSNGRQQDVQLMQMLFRTGGEAEGYAVRTIILSLDGVRDVANARVSIHSASYLGVESPFFVTDRRRSESQLFFPYYDNVINFEYSGNLGHDGKVFSSPVNARRLRPNSFYVVDVDLSETSGAVLKMVSSEKPSYAASGWDLINSRFCVEGGDCTYLDSYYENYYDDIPYNLAFPIQMFSRAVSYDGFRVDREDNYIVEGSEVDAEFIFRGSRPFDRTMDIYYEFTGTAEEGKDFIVEPQGASPITIPAGSYHRIVPLTIIDDSLPEIQESIGIRVLYYTAAELGGWRPGSKLDSRKTNIIDNDTAIVSVDVSASPPNFVVGQPIDFQFTLDVESEAYLHIYYTMSSGRYEIIDSEGRADGDPNFSYRHGNVRLDPGASSQNIRMWTREASDVNTEETITVSVTRICGFSASSSAGAERCIQTTDHQNKSVTVTIQESGDSQSTTTQDTVTVSGTTEIGQTISADTSGIGNSSNRPSSPNFSYQWQITREQYSDKPWGANMYNVGEDSVNYQLSKEDFLNTGEFQLSRGGYVRVVVSYTSNSGQRIEVPSNHVNVVIREVDEVPVDAAPIGEVEVVSEALYNGATDIGGTLVADISSIQDPVNGLSDPRFRYQWQRGDNANDASPDNVGLDSPMYILGAGDDNYYSFYLAPSRADLDVELGKFIRVVVTFTDDDEFEHTMTSAYVGPVTAAAYGQVHVNGDFVSIGQTLTADVSRVFDLNGLSRASYSYQWKRADSLSDQDPDDVGTDSNSYTLVSDDSGKYIMVEVNFTDDDGHEESISSNSIGPVGLGHTVAAGEVTIDGVPEIGHILTANTSNISDLIDGLTTPVYRYQWKRGTSSSDLNPQNIGTNSATYTLVSGDKNKYIQVEVTFTDDNNNRESKLSAYVGQITRANVAATGDTAIDGNLEVGQILTANISTIADQVNGLSSTSYSYQWQRADNNFTTESYGTNLTNIGTDSSTYTLSKQDVGKYIRVVVTFNDDDGNMEIKRSPYVGPVTPARASTTGSVVINGEAEVGQVLMADTTTIVDPDGLNTPNFRYQWRRGNSGDDSTPQEIGTDSASYTLITEDDGKHIRVVVNYTDDQGNEETKTSTYVGPVVLANTAATGSVTIDGTVEIGQLLTANTASILDSVNGLTTPSYSYQWKRGDSTSDENPEDIGADSVTYATVAEDDNKYIQVVVTFLDDDGHEETMTSNYVGPVVLADTAATGDVTISGTNEVGQALTADITGIADSVNGLGSPDYSYQWRRGNSASDAGPTDIGTDSANYTLVNEDDGKYIQVVVTFNDDDGHEETKTSAYVGPVVLSNTTATGDVTISGTAEVGQTLAVDTSGIADPVNGLTAPGYSYQWQRRDDANDTTPEDISSATSSAHTLAKADEGKQVRVIVTFTDDDGHEETKTSTYTGSIATRADTAATGDVTISGTAEIGQMLTADTSDIVDPVNGLTIPGYSYQWKRGHNASDTSPDNIGTDSATYTLVAGDDGKHIQVVVSFTDDDGHEETKTSAYIGPVVLPNTLATGDVTITGTVEVGQSISADTSGIADPVNGLTASSYSYQWKRGDSASDATPDDIGTDSATYTLVAGDNDKHIRVVVTFTDDDGHEETKTSAYVGPVVLSNTAATGSVTVTGKTEINQTLTAITTSIADPVNGLTTASYSYQWKRGDSADDTTPDDIGVDSPSYALVAGDNDKHIRVVVTFTDDDGHEESKTSTYVGPVVLPNTAAMGDVTITGTAEIGQALTAITTSIVDTVNGLSSPSYSYQWKRGDSASDSSPDDIGTDSATYTLLAEDDDKHIQVVVSFIDDDGHMEAMTSPYVGPVVLPNTEATGDVAISGTTEVGQILTADTTDIADPVNGLASPSYSYQWKRGDSASDASPDDVGTDAATYTLVDGDDGKHIQVVASFTDDDGHEETKTSVYVGPVVLPNTPATGNVTISGTAEVGHTLMVDTTGITDPVNGLVSPIYSYQWKRGDSASDSSPDNIGTDSATYTLVTGDDDKHIRVVVTFSDDDRHEETKTSAYVGPVVLPDTAATGEVTIGAVAQVGVQLSADTSGIADPVNGLTTPGFTYQWERRDNASDTTPEDITGATTMTYTPVDDDQGKQIRVEVTFTDDDGYQETKASAYTGSVSALANTAATGDVTIDGNVEVGQSLMADTSGIADTVNGLTTPSYSYQWKRGDSASDTDPGNIGSNSASYTLVEGDDNKYIRVVVTFMDDDGHEETKTSVYVGPVTRANTAATGDVTISGDVETGQTLTADISGILDPVNGLTTSSYSYQWKRGDSASDASPDNIGTDSATYTLVAGDDDKHIRVMVTFTDDDGHEEMKTSVYVGPVVLADTAATGDVTIGGSTETGQTLSANTSSIADPVNGLSSPSYSYQWKRGDSVSDATPDDIGTDSATYTLVAEDDGKHIRVVVTFTDDDGYEETKTSAYVGPVVLPNTAATGDVTVTGTVEVGQILSANTSGIADPVNGLTTSSYSYHWKRGDSSADTTPDDIGTDSATYTLVAGDDDKYIRVVVTFTDDDGHEETKTSTYVGPVVLPNTKATGDVTVSGTAEVGQTLTANTSSIADPINGLTTVSYSYQWKRGDSVSDATPDDIGTDSATYTLVAEDDDKHIRVVVIFTDDDGYEETKTSTYVGAVVLSNTAATGDVTISGSAEVGQTLTANVSGIADPVNGLTTAIYSYQWKRGDSAGDTTPGDIGTDSATYTLVAGDDDKHIRVVVTFNDDDGHEETKTSAYVGPVVLPNTRATGDVTLSGTTEVGQTLTVNTSGIADPVNGLTTASYSYQWKRGDSSSDTTPDDIGTDSATYTLVAGDDDKHIRVVVTFNDDDGYEETKTSTYVGPVVLPNTAATGDVTISGTAEVGQTLTADTSSIADSVNGLSSPNYSYQWKRGGSASDTTPVDIGTDSATYTLVSGDDDMHIRVVVTFTDDDGHEESKTSAYVGPVTRADTAATGDVTISGVIEIGQTLRAITTSIADPVNGLASPSYSYQWKRGDSASDAAPDDIGTDSANYTLVAGDNDKHIRVVVTFVDDDGYEETKTSTYVGPVVLPNTAATGDATISGTAEVGQTLTTITSSIADSVNGLTSPSYSYQWQRGNSASDTSPVDIGTDSATYTLAGGDDDGHIRVVVTFADDDGHEETKTSIYVGPVVLPNTAATGAVTIGGTAEVGQTLTAITSSIEDRVNGLITSSYSYQWQRGDSASDANPGNVGTDSSTYTLVSGDNDKHIRVVVSFTDDDGHEETKISTYTGSVALANVAATGDVTISGTPAVDQPLAANTSGITDLVNGLTTPVYRYRWERRGSASDTTPQTVSGATSATYTPAKEDQGAQIRVVVTFTDDDGYEETKESVFTGSIAARANTPATGNVAVTGTAQVDVQLVADISAIADPVNGLSTLNFRYQWRSVDADGTSNAADIGADVSIYTPVKADQGRRIFVVVSFVDDDGHAEVKTATPTAVVAARANTPATGTVFISGIGRAGETLTANSSDISDVTNGIPNSVVYTYQWYRAESDAQSDIATRTPISGETSSTYVLAVEDEGKAIVLSVRFMDGDGHAEVLTSAAFTVEVFPQVTVSAASGSVTEGSPAVFNLVRTGDLSSPMTARYAVWGTPLGGRQMLTNPPPTNAEVTFATNSSTVAVSLATVDDDVDEPSTTVMLTLQPDSEIYRLGSTGTRAYVEVTDNDLPIVTVTAVSAAVTEGSPAIFQFVRTGVQTGSLTVSFDVDGGAQTLAGAPASSVTFSAGSPTAIVSLATVDDTDDEPNSTLTLTIQPNTAAYSLDAFGTRSASVTVRDDDDPLELSVSLPDRSLVAEGESLVFRVSLNRASAQTVTVPFALGGSAAAWDYTVLPSSPLTFSPGDTARLVTVEALNDAVDESDETITVTLRTPTAGDASLGDEDSAIGTIQDSRAPLIASVTAPTPSLVTEGGSLSFSVSLNRASSQTVAVPFVLGGDAESPDDYTTTTASPVTFSPGDTSISVSLTTVDDDIDEQEEQITVTLQQPAAGDAVLGTTTATSTIQDNDEPLVVSIFSPNPSEVDEGDDLVFIVTLSRTSTEEITVPFALRGEATVSDYTVQPASSLTFPAGTTVILQEITVTTIDDFEADDDETVQIALLAPEGGGAIISSDPERISAEGTIRSESPAIISVESQTVAEGGEGETQTVTFDVRMRPTLPYPVEVPFELANQPSQSSAGVRVVAHGPEARALGGRNGNRQMLYFPAYSETPTNPPTIEVTGDNEDNDDRTLVLQLGEPTVVGVDADSNPAPEIASAPRAGSSDGTVAAATVVVRDDEADGEQRSTALAHVLSGLGRAYSTSMVDLVWSRADALDSSTNRSTAVIGGRSLDTEAFGEDQEAARAAKEIARLFGVEFAEPPSVPVGDYSRSPFDGGVDIYRQWAGISDSRSFAARTRFAVPLGENKDSGGAFTFWGQGDYRTFGGESEDDPGITSDGSSTSGQIGFDYRLGENSLAGVAFSRTSGSTDYEFADSDEGKGTVKSSITGATPYLHWKASDRVALWGAFGFGTGKAEIDDGRGPVAETDLSTSLAAVGLRSQAAQWGGFDLAVNFDWYTADLTADAVEGGNLLEETSAEASRARFAFEGTSRRTLASGGGVTGRFEVGARQDDGDGGEGIGADVAGEARFASKDGGLRLRVSGSALLYHEQGDFSEGSIGLGLDYDPGATDRGFQLSLEPAWNASFQKSSSSMWDSDGRYGDMAYEGDGAALTARAGHGAGVIRDRVLLTSYGEAEAGEHVRRLRLGVELKGLSGTLERLSSNLYGERREGSESPEHAVKLEVRIGF